MFQLPGELHRDGESLVFPAERGEQLAVPDGFGIEELAVDFVRARQRLA
jgi:hypothetical protein